MIPRLTDGLEFHGRALVLRAERQRVLAGNIANADTPGYKARDFDFAAALRSASGSASSSGNGGIGAGIAGDVMAGTGTGAGPGGRTVSTTLRYAQPAQNNLDNNSVDMDRERAAMAENTVKYEATLRFINGSVRTTLDAMKSHQQG